MQSPDPDIPPCASLLIGATLVLIIVMLAAIALACLLSVIAAIR